MANESFGAAQVEQEPLQRPHAQRAWRRLVGALCPHPGSVITTLVLIAALLFAQSALARSPRPNAAPAASSTTTISYQGRLQDSNGNPITTTNGIAMQFALYNTDTGGSPLWSETQPAVPVENGLFHVLLGSVNPIPVTVLSSNPALWVGVTVGSDSEMTPRDQLASVPFAMVAQSLAGGVSSDQIADGAITTTKLADGAVTAAKISSDASAPSRIQNWQDSSDHDFTAYGPVAANAIDTGISVTVPAGQAYSYLIVYDGLLAYEYSERANSSSGFYGQWDASVLANSTEVSSETHVVYTGYREDWSALGNNTYWHQPYHCAWLIRFRLGAGTYELQIQIKGYSDNSMNQVHVADQSGQVMQLY